MSREEIITTIRTKYQLLLPSFTERTKRLWCAAEANQLGRGGITIVQQATGVSMPTIRKGINELKQPTELTPLQSRRPGGGRKKVTDKYPNVQQELNAIIEPVTRGDPESPLRWTCKSTRKLSDELKERNIDICPNAVSGLLYEMGYSLQANRKTREGIDHPDRNEQFLYINEQVKKFLRAGQPVISVDAKKKENIGNYSMKGRVYCPKSKPIETNMHDFPDEILGKAIPYGVYDIGRNEGWVNIGISRDTAEFAINSIRRWWLEMGQHRFPKATRLLMTADAGGSNNPRTRLWKVGLRKLADELQLNITVCHFPPGTSKWNKIEHRLFSFISQNWRGHPLYDMATIVNLISHTTTKNGLVVRCAVDDTMYEKGIKICDCEFDALGVKEHSFHGDWNYTINKRNIK